MNEENELYPIDYGQSSYEFVTSPGDNQSVNFSDDEKEKGRALTNFFGNQ